MTSVSISRTALTTTDPLVVHGSKASGTPSILRDGLLLPALQARRVKMPDSRYLDGSEDLGATWAESVLGLNVRLAAANEAAFRAAYFDLVAAIGQHEYTSTVDLGGTTYVYWCKRGDIRLMTGYRAPSDAGMTVDYFNISIPCQPIPVEVSV